MKKLYYVVGLLMLTGLLTGCNTNVPTTTPVVADSTTNVIVNDSHSYATPLFTGDNSITFEMNTEGTERVFAKGVKVTAKFTQEFMDKYMYEDSKSYYFALKINDQYYNVFRNRAGGVSNDLSRHLTGAIPAYKFKDGYTWYIPFGQINVAKDKHGYGYVHSTFIQSDVYKIGISSVKEGVKTHDFIVDWY